MRSWLTMTCAVFTLSLCGVSPLPAQASLTPGSLSPCPFTPAEVESALGVRVEDGQAADMSWPGGRDVGCLYAVQGSDTVLSVRQIWDPANAGSVNQASARPAGGLQAIPGDPDGAKWKAGGKDDPSVELLYERGKVRTRVLIHGATIRESDMQPRLLRLKRVP
jgi:hypothetical protein